MENKNLKEELLDFYRKHKIVIWVIGVFITLLFICSIINILYSITQVFFLNKKIDNFGLIGDSAGLLNSIFSGLAFLGVIITVFLQSKELKQTTTELKNQKEEFQIQNQTLKRQQFENTFFNMLKTQENIVSGLALSSSTTSTTAGVVGHYISKSMRTPLPSSTTSTTVEVKGRKVFESLYNNYLDETIGKLAFYDRAYPNTKFDDCDASLTKEKILEEYNNPCIEMKMLDHYFRHMYRIVKFVDETDFSFCLDDKEDKNKTEEEKQNKMKDEKYQYTSILRATLSPYELALLFYNCLNKEENKSRKNKFSPLIEEYCLLQNIRSEFLKKETLGYYKNEAYGNRYEDIKKELEKNN